MFSLTCDTERFNNDLYTGFISLFPWPSVSFQFQSKRLRPPATKATQYTGICLEVEKQFNEFVAMWVRRI